MDNFNGQNDPGVAFLLAFNYIRETSNAQDALAFITDVYNKISDKGKDIPLEEIHESFKAKFGASKFKDVFEPESEYDVGRTLAKDYLDRSGFQEESLPQVLMNGVPLGKRTRLFLNNEKKFNLPYITCITYLVFYFNYFVCQHYIKIILFVIFNIVTF